MYDLKYVTNVGVNEKVWTVITRNVLGDFDS